MFIDYPIRRHSQGMYKEVTYIRMRKIQYLKNKTSLIIIKVQLIIISSVILYISETNCTSSSLEKKKTLKKERGKENEMEKRRRRKEFVRQKERKRKAKGREEGRMR